MQMTKRRSKMQSQAPCPPRTNAGDNSIEEIKSHTPEIFEIIASEVKKQLQKGIEEIIPEVISEVKKEIILIIEEVLSASKDNDKK